MNTVIWTGIVNDKTTRIRRLTVDDCLVEVQSNATGEWEACDDETASAAYMAAFLHTFDRLSFFVDHTPIEFRQLEVDDCDLGGVPTPDKTQ